MINLDGPDEFDPEIEVPKLTPWEFTDAYSGARVSMTYDPDREGGVLLVEHGDQTEGAYMALRVEFTVDELLDLAGRIITPTMEYDSKRKALEAKERELSDRVAYEKNAAKGFAITRSGKKFDTVHVRSCPSVESSKWSKSGDGNDVLGEWRQACIQLERRMSTMGVRSTLHRESLVASGRIRDVSDFVAIRFCARCKPLGDITEEASAEVLRLGNVRSVDAAREQELAQLVNRVNEAIWATEQAHLDALRGRG